MSSPLLLDLTHTCHTRARTGIQRVVRALHAALGSNAVAVTFDPFAKTWRTLEPWERANLVADTPAPKRGAQWPIIARWRGRFHRALRRNPPRLPENSGLLVAEVFSPAVARALPGLFSRTRGPRLAVFHDAIALRLPEMTPPKTVARFPAYLVDLLAFDGVVAVSEESRQSLLDYWAWIGARTPPPVRTIGWGIDERRPMEPPAAAIAARVPVVLSVGSIEGRKNHCALLDGCEHLWARGVEFELHLIGLAQPQTGRAALARIAALRAAGRNLRYDGAVSDDAVRAAYARCAFTVYPSLMEGFGLPVLESLAHGKPCICSARGALGEAARGGGCLALDQVDPPALAGAIERVLRSPEERARLELAARARKLKTWTECASEFRGWMHTLAPRD